MNALSKPREQFSLDQQLTFLREKYAAAVERGDHTQRRMAWQALSSFVDTHQKVLSSS